MSPARSEGPGPVGMWLRETLWPVTKTLGVVVPVTLLIWIIAESESMRTQKHRVEVVLSSSPQSERAIRLGAGASEFTGSATMTIQGPTARVDAVLAQLRGPIVLEPGAPGVPLDPGPALVDLRTALGAIGAVQQGRVAITEVEPAIVPVVIEAIVERQARVRVERPTMWQGAAWAGTAWDEMAVEASPSRVTVRLSESQAKLLDDGSGEALVVARVPSSAMEGLVEGRSAVISAVPIELPPSLRDAQGRGQLRVAPTQVTVTLTPRAAK